MTPRPRVAAIDCGTNAIRLLVADVVPGPRGPSLLDVHREERIIRLGEGVDATGRLTSGALDRAWHALSDYVAVIRASGTDAVRMAATSATRDADNRDEFVAMVTRTLGQPPEVISGDVEAALSYQGAVADLDPDDGPFLVVDIGGGSTELVVGDASGPRAAVSVDIGSVRVTERALRGDPPPPAVVAAARSWVKQVLEQGLDRLRSTGSLSTRPPRTVVAVSGTAMTVAAATLYRRGIDPGLAHLAMVTPADVTWAATLLLRATTAHRAALPWLHPGRVDVIGAGALIMSTLTDLLVDRGITGITVSEHDILDALALSLAPPD